MFWCYFYPNIPTKTRQASFPEEENMIMQNDAVIQQVLNRTERRIEQLGTVDKPTLKVINCSPCVSGSSYNPTKRYL